MKTNLKVIFSFLGIAALLTSPAIAKQAYPHGTAPLAIPQDARASAVPYRGNEGGPYTPSITVSRYGKSRDFQGGGGDK